MSQITFGALSPKLHEQLGEPRLRLALQQRFADAVTLLLIHGLLTDAEAHRARKRLCTNIARELARASQEKTA